ncbi:MAG: cytochrome c biogenesis CcdA family protein [Treponema sp.]|jgi:cytochrome c-type biogenesis protein|nr:cytochrome c biogenesis CcdA family protein [Treponema sp.]
MDNKVSVLTALAAGMLSFFSPCVLPLLSSYLFFISGLNAEEALENTDIKDPGTVKLFSRYRLKIIVSTLFFIAGFSVIFIALSVLVYGFVFFLGGAGRIVNVIAGSLVIILGFNILFNFIPFLKYDDSGDRCATCVPEHSILALGEGSVLHPAGRRGGFLGSFLFGLAFGAGWTPCVGVFLGSVLLMAGQSETVGLSVFYLALYSAGLGLPFLVTAFFWSAVLRRLHRFSRFMPALKTVSGVFLILIGLVMASGRLVVLNAFFSRWFPWFFV